MIDRPGQWPDTNVFPHDVPKTFFVPFTNSSGPIDLSASTVSVVVQDDGVEIGSLAVDLGQADEGVISLTVGQDVYDTMGRYATWRLRESPFFGGDLVVQGRLVKEA